MKKNRIAALYLLMLAGHAAHVYEEVWGRFWLLNEFGLGWYLAINWVLFCIPLALFFYVLKEARWTYMLGIVYAVFMGLQGVGHNIAAAATGRYFDGFAGGYSGIGMLVVSVPMIYYLRKALQEPRQRFAIEDAAIEDAGEILSLQKLSYLSEAEIYGDYAIQPLTESPGEIREEFAGGVVLKVADEHGIIGSVRAREKDGTCYIGKLIVHPRYRNRGIGTRLMHEIERRFGGVSRYELFTGDRSDKNIALYKKLSYAVYKTQTVNEKLSLVYFEKYNSTDPTS